MALRANQADQALIMYEAGQTLVPMEQLTTTDRQAFASSDAPWSGAAGYEPVIRPDGIRTGAAITPTPAANDSVDVALGTAYQGGMARDSITAATLATGQGLTRPSAGEFAIHSIVVNASGAYAVEAGTATTDQSGFKSARGVAGGPPYIPVGEIEVGQVRMTGGSAAPVVAADIRQIPGTSMERFDYPIPSSEDYLTGEITFASALPAIHNDDPGTDPDESKSVWVEYYTADFAPLEPASDFVPPETTHSQSSTAVYGGAVGSSSSSLAQGSFSAYLKDGVTDPLLGLKNQKLLFKFFPHRLRAQHILCQGVLGISRQFPADNSIVAECTITADGAAIEVAE